MMRRGKQTARVITYQFTDLIIAEPHLLKIKKTQQNPTRTYHFKSFHFHIAKLNRDDVAQPV